MELKLRYYGDPILREEAADVEDFDEELFEQAAAMIETMVRERGIGLAGPQVGLRKKILIALKMADLDDSDADPVVVVNPEILERSRDTWVYEEGCLSIPGVNGDVTRSEKIKLRYQDVGGAEHVIEASGMFARILLHEIDHLHGKLFIDYLSTARKSLLKPKLNEISKTYNG